MKERAGRITARVLAAPRLLLLVLLLMPGRAAWGDQLDEVVRSEMERRQLPGVAVAVTRGSEVLKCQGYGSANLEWKTPADGQTVFELASLTKQFTAVGIEILASEGKLSVDDPITKHLFNLPKSWSKITLRHLLTHTSGLKNYTALTNSAKLSLSPVSAPELVMLLRDYPLEFEPGERYAYSNTGYFLLGVVIEIASGQPYDEFLRTRLFQPLGMDATRLNSNEQIIPRRAAGYSREGRTLKNAGYIHYSWPFAAGALVSSAEDMARWHVALLQGRVLPQERLEEMWKPAALNNGGESSYGFGWAVKKVRGKKVLNHAGALPGFTAFSEIVPELKLSVTVLINSEDANPERIAENLLAAVEPQLKLTAIPDEHPEYTELTRKTFAGWAAGDLSTAPLSARMREHLEKDLPGSSAFIKSLGSLQKIEVLEQSVSAEEAEFAYRVVFQNGVLKARFTFNAQKEATRIEIHRE